MWSRRGRDEAAGLGGGQRCDGGWAKAPRQVWAWVLAVAVAFATVGGSAAARTEGPPGAGAATEHRRVVVAVFPVEVSKGLRVGAAVVSAVRDQVALALVRSGRYRVAASGVMEGLLQQQRRKSHAPCYDMQCQIEVGKQLAASKVVGLELVRLGRKQCHFVLRLYDVARGVLDGGAAVDGGCAPASLVKLADAAVAQLTGAGPVSAARAGAQGRGTAPAAGGVPSTGGHAPGAAVATARPAPRSASGSARHRPVARSGAAQCPAGFVYVPPGTFWMGSPEGEPGRDDDEGPKHRLWLTHGFCLGRTEVTQGQFEERMGTNPSRFKVCGAHCPVERVTWWDALAYANARSRAEGLRPCYRLVGCKGRAGSGMTCDQVQVQAPGANPYRCEGYRLPTEAEWEYAYRAGTTTAFYNGPITKPIGRDPNLDAIGWYDANSGGHPHPVKQKAPNAWGLYDMAGNVWEWCWDWYGEDYYAHSPVVDPRGPGGGTHRVYRGGAWNSVAPHARAAHRLDDYPGDRYGDLGFRLARTVNP